MAERGKMQKILCPACGKKSLRNVSAINRAKKMGLKIYCNKKCSAIGHRKENPKTSRNPNWKQMKADYDREYRRKNKKLLKKKKQEYFQATYDPKQAAIERKKTMPQHVEYCRQPEYKAYKAKYDKKIRAEQFGDFKDAYAVLLKLTKEIKKQMPNRFERYAQAQRQQWNPVNQQRRRRGNSTECTDRL
jgi:hypothetical protein